MKPGLYLVHKPVGPTSFSIVREFQQEAEVSGGRRLAICHGGTLDPFAEGLLLVLVGQATRLFDHLHAIPKVYEAELAWGRETDNGDPGGRVIAEGDPSTLTPGAIEQQASTFLGWSDQVPPATSAKKIEGEPAYRKVHRGETVELPPSRVYLHALRWIDHTLPTRSRVELTCRGGYYVRAFARDLGRRLGCPAHLSALRRTAIGPWSDPGPGRRVHVGGAELLPWLPSRGLTDQDLGALRKGESIPRGRVEPPAWPLPAAFLPGEPDQERVRAFHRDRLSALLRPAEGGFALELELRGGL
ncbi:MAG: tRNA pseudouridine(55) synthase TruB [Myxococcaceae bacterium]